MTPRAELKTARLTLRPVEPQDQAVIVACLNDLDVSGWLAVVPWPYAAADFRRFQTVYAVPGQTYAVDDAEGFAGILGIEDRTLGYWFAPRCHARGYATEAARAALADHLAQNADDIASGYFEGNLRSANVLKKLGFVETGRDMKFCLALNKDRPHVSLTLTRDAFVAGLPIEAHSARLTYRPRQAVDLPAMQDLVSRPEVLRNLGPTWPWPADPAFTLTRSTPYLGQGFVWGIFLGGLHIGSVGVTEGELGYLLHPDHWGQGLASEAVERTLTRAFDEDGLDEVHAGVWADNLASLGLLRKFGFQITGEDMGTNALRPAPSPGFTLSLTRADWQARALIRTPRLSLRPMTRADAPSFHAFVTRPEVVRMMFMIPTVWSLAEAEDFLKEWRWQGKLRFRLALIAEGEWAGWIGVSDDLEPEIFYGVRPEFAGRGLAREAVAGFCAFLFDRFDPPALTAGVFTDNPASATVLRASGFALIREELHASRGRLAPSPCWVYRLSNPKGERP
jgi:RimJ/RimL family protein N-acetyltransferase